MRGGHGSVDGAAVAKQRDATEPSDRTATGITLQTSIDAAQRAAEQINAPVRTNIEVYGYRSPQAARRFF